MAKVMFSSLLVYLFATLKILASMFVWRFVRLSVCLSVSLAVCLYGWTLLAGYRFPKIYTGFTDNSRMLSHIFTNFHTQMYFCSVQKFVVFQGLIISFPGLIMVKWMSKFAKKFQDRLAVTQGKIWDIFGDYPFNPVYRGLFLSIFWIDLC